MIVGLVDKLFSDSQKLVDSFFIELPDDEIDVMDADEFQGLKLYPQHFPVVFERLFVYLLEELVLVEGVEVIKVVILVPVFKQIGED